MFFPLLHLGSLSFYPLQQTLTDFFYEHDNLRRFTRRIHRKRNIFCAFKIHNAGNVEGMLKVEFENDYFTVVYQSLQKKDSLSLSDTDKEDSLS